VRESPQFVLESNSFSVQRNGAEGDRPQVSQSLREQRRRSNSLRRTSTRDLCALEDTKFEVLPTLRGPDGWVSIAWRRRREVEMNANRPAVPVGGFPCTGDCFGIIHGLVEIEAAVTRRYLGPGGDTGLRAHGRRQKGHSKQTKQRAMRIHVD
jgi:hypothetical protein